MRELHQTRVSQYSTPKHTSAYAVVNQSHARCGNTVQLGSSKEIRESAWFSSRILPLHYQGRCADLTSETKEATEGCRRLLRRKWVKGSLSNEMMPFC